MLLFSLLSPLCELLRSWGEHRAGRNFKYKNSRRILLYLPNSG